MSEVIKGNTEEREVKLTTKPSICLVMIVKNESNVIRRCLDSVAPYINYWVIVDTGSTDGTQDIIRSHMSELGIAGSLYERPWKDYGTNRTESLQLSAGKCDYRLIIDADDILEVKDPNVFLDLKNDSYRIPIRLVDISYHRTQLVRSSQKWVYIGVLHEYISYADEGEYTEGELPGVAMIAGVSGDKREIKGKDKYYNDALIFEKELLSNTELSEGLRSRYTFYCAQSYRDAGLNDRAIDLYQKRIAQGGWPEEVYISKYSIAKLKGLKGDSVDSVIAALMDAWEYRPIRLEAAYELIKILMYQERYFLAFTIGHICLKMGGCTDVLFVEQDIWKWKFMDDYAVACFKTGNLEEAQRCITTLVNAPIFSEIPEKDRARITKNRDAFDAAIKEKEEYINQTGSNEQPVQPPAKKEKIDGEN